jgi:hypothetical protein
MRHLTRAVLACAVLLTSAGHVTRAQPTVSLDDLQGTWAIVSIKDVKTGQVDEIGKRRTIWLQLTRSHWTYIWMDLDREVITPAELEKLAPEVRTRKNYAKIWDADHKPRFWGAGGSYRLEGNRFVYTDVVSIEPHMINHKGVEIVASVDRQTYVRHSIDDHGVVVRESIFKRLD